MPESTLRFYNTLTQSLETFEPREPGKAKVYVCGITTYDLAHAGHARTYTTFDVLARHLSARGYEVTVVRNVTDIDDRIIARARENGEEPLALSARVSDICDDNLRAIGVKDPDHEPKVSTHIKEIVELIEELIAKGHAYVARTEKGQDVYFAVRSFTGYGKLSRRNLDDLRAGERVEIGESKRDPLDFALWKGESEAAFGWPSPWGKGRPGWHIECSAMARKYLGAHFDIHCGGMDLIFPHHENEIAQSEAAWGPPFARYWLHGGFLNVDKEKMSKSLGNFVTIADVLARNDPEALRYFLLGAHYRGPVSFDIEKKEGGRVAFPGVDEAERRVDYLYGTKEALVAAASGQVPSTASKELAAHAKVVTEAKDRVLDALDKDLNTPMALSAIADLAKAGNDIALQVSKLKKNQRAHDAARALAAAAVSALEACSEPLGLMQASPAVFAERTRARRLHVRGLVAAQVEAKVKERAEARAAKDFARGDAVRAELAALGVELLDAPAGATVWKVGI